MDLESKYATVDATTVATLASLNSLPQDTNTYLAVAVIGAVCEVDPYGEINSIETSLYPIVNAVSDLEVVCNGAAEIADTVVGVAVASCVELISEVSTICKGDNLLEDLGSSLQQDVIDYIDDRIPAKEKIRDLAGANELKDEFWENTEALVQQMVTESDRVDEIIRHDQAAARDIKPTIKQVFTAISASRSTYSMEMSDLKGEHSRHGDMCKAIQHAIDETISETSTAQAALSKVAVRAAYRGELLQNGVSADPVPPASVSAVANATDVPCGLRGLNIALLELQHNVGHHHNTMTKMELLNDAKLAKLSEILDRYAVHMEAICIRQERITTIVDVHVVLYAFVSIVATNIDMVYTRRLSIGEEYYKGLLLLEEKLGATGIKQCRAWLLMPRTMNVERLAMRCAAAGQQQQDAYDCGDPDGMAECTELLASMEKKKVHADSMVAEATGKLEAWKEQSRYETVWQQLTVRFGETKIPDARVDPSKTSLEEEARRNARSRFDPRSWVPAIGW
jgi:hypothetical protein